MMSRRNPRIKRSRYARVSTRAPRIEDLEHDVFENPVPGSLLRPIWYRKGDRMFIPLGGEFGVLLALSLSLLFIFSISLSFTNANNSLYFKEALDETARLDPGVVLIGEDIDPDIDEPTVGVRWRVAGCGEGFVVPKSPPVHRSTSCGVLTIPVEIYIDGSEEASVRFDPTTLPKEPVTDRLMLVQNLFEFDSNHALDVHTSRFYPFDTYSLTTTLRIEEVNSSSETIPLRVSATPITQHSSSFVFTSASRQGTVVGEDGTTYPIRHIEIWITRPGSARAYVMLLFGVNWLLAHCCIGVVVLAKRQRAPQDRDLALNDALKQLGVVFGILLAVPKLRAMMPDAPGFDGVLIDTVGYFPQMTMIGFALVLLLLLTASRILDAPSRKARPFSPSFSIAKVRVGDAGKSKSEFDFACPSARMGRQYELGWYDETGSLEATPSWHSPSPFQGYTGRSLRKPRGGY